MLEDHLNPRELEGSMEVKKSDEEVFKPAGNCHHYHQQRHKDDCIYIEGTRNQLYIVPGDFTILPLKYRQFNDKDVTN